MKKIALILAALLGLSATAACDDLTRGCHESVDRNGNIIIECR